DLLARGGALRLLAGDYLDVTEPNALLRLLDLEGNVELRVFEATATSFHPKAYLFYERDGKRTAYVGSSNLTEMARAQGAEWTYRIVAARDRAGFADVAAAYTKLFRHPATRRLDYGWVESYRQRRTTRVGAPIEVAPEPPAAPPQPHSVQVEALAALE